MPFTPQARSILALDNRPRLANSHPAPISTRTFVTPVTAPVRTPARKGPPVLDTPVLVALLLGAVISLVTSVTVTAFQARQIRRTDVRASSRSSARSLMSTFIAERDSGDSKDSFLTEAEVTVMAMTDHKTRDRLRHVIRLLRERELPEVQELSGVKAERARELLCDHALEVLGAHLRSERLPELPSQVRTMLSVEEEALSIRSGEAPQTGEALPKSSVTARPRHTGGKSTTRKKPATKPAAPKSAGKSRTAAAEAEKEKESAFWDD